MVILQRHHRVFSYRVAGVALHDGHVLVQRAEADTFWALPGGSVEIGEYATQALVREMQEEINTTVTVERLLWMIENFFDWRDGRTFHELGLYYLMTLPDDSPLLDVSRTFDGQEDFFLHAPLRLIFRWVPLAEVAALDLYPVFLRDALTELPDHPVTVINDERQEEQS